MNQIQEHNLHLKIIKHCILYSKGQKQLKELILSDLKVLVKHYNQSITKTSKIEYTEALIRFIDYTPNAMESICKLYYSI